MQFDTLRELEQLRLQPNDTVSPKSLKCYISIGNRLIALKFDAEVKYLKLHIKRLSMTRVSPKLHSLTTLCTPQIFKIEYLNNQLSDCFKI